MRFYIDTKELNAGLSTIIKALSNRTTIGVLEGVYIQTLDNGIMMKCSDLSLQIETVLNATIEENGSIVLPGRIFFEMAKRFPGETTEIHTEGSTTYITSGRSRTSLQAMDADDYPDMPSLAVKHEFELSQAVIKNMIKASIFSIAQDDIKPILTGVLLKVQEDLVSMVALDGYRLAMAKVHIPQMIDEMKVVIPGKSLSELNRILSDDENEKAKITVTRTHITFDLGYTVVITRLMDGEFIKYDQILPHEHTTLVRINRPDFLEGIERASLMAREGKNNLIKLSFVQQKVTITANSELGRTSEDVAANITGNDIDIAFNARYLSDVLRSVEDEEIYMEFTNNISPCIIKPIRGDFYYYLILPVRLFAAKS